MSETQPALTAEEWRQQLGPWEDWEDEAMPLPVKDGDIEEYMVTGTASAHRVAALCLYGQPFGFTWEDVDLLLVTAEEAADWARPYPDGCDEARAPYLALADRIAALLPPRDR